MEKALQILLVVILSSTKFMTAPITALNIGFGYVETLIVTSLGGMFGVVFFFFLSNAMARLAHRFRSNKEPEKPKPKKKTFTWKNKMVVKVKRKFGLIGLAVLTPTLLSIPVGTFLAARYFHDKRKVFLYLFTSVILWSVLISSVVMIF